MGGRRVNCKVINFELAPDNLFEIYVEWAALGYPLFRQKKFRRNYISVEFLIRNSVKIPSEKFRGIPRNFSDGIKFRGIPWENSDGIPWKIRAEFREKFQRNSVKNFGGIPWKFRWAFLYITVIFMNPWGIPTNTFFHIKEIVRNKTTQPQKPIIWTKG